MKKFKQLTAVALAVTMVAGSSMAVLAEEPVKEGTVTGSGELEGTVDTDVWNVVLPTEVAGDTTYNFILDPEGLITATNAAHYQGKTFEANASLFFNNAAADKVTDYSSTSDAKQIVNKSSYAVDVTVTATVTPGEGISINPDSTFANDTTPSIYLAVVDSEAQTEAIGSTGTTVVSATMDGAADGSYEIVYADGAYKCQLKADVEDSAFDTYSFQLTGACNTAAKWSGLEQAAPAVNVVYSVDKHADNAAPGMTNTTYDGTGALVVPYSLGAGADGASALTDVAFSYNGTNYSKNGVWNSDTSMSQYITIADGNVTLDAFLAEYIGQADSGTEYSFYLIFDDDTENFVTGTVTISK